MDAIEVVDDTVLPWTDEKVFPTKFLRYCRPLLTEADMIAAAAPAGEVEIRFMLEVMPDDIYESHHDKHVCGICAPVSTGYVPLTKHTRTQEMDEYDVDWDPTILL